MADPTLLVLPLVAAAFCSCGGSISSPREPYWVYETIIVGAGVARLVHSTLWSESNRPWQRRANIGASMAVIGVVAYCTGGGRSCRSGSSSGPPPLCRHSTRPSRGPASSARRSPWCSARSPSPCTLLRHSFRNRRFRAWPGWDSSAPSWSSNSWEGPRPNRRDWPTNCAVPSGGSQPWSPDPATSSWSSPPREQSNTPARRSSRSSATPLARRRPTVQTLIHPDDIGGCEPRWRPPARRRPPSIRRSGCCTWTGTTCGSRRP